MSGAQRTRRPSTRIPLSPKTHLGWQEDAPACDANSLMSLNTVRPPVTGSALLFLAFFHSPDFDDEEAIGFGAVFVKSHGRPIFRGYGEETEGPVRQPRAHAAA
jgi:hypothetical protein